MNAQALATIRKYLDAIATLDRPAGTDSGMAYAHALGQANGLASLALIELDVMLASQSRRNGGRR